VCILYLINVVKLVFICALNNLSYFALFCMFSLERRRSGSFVAPASLSTHSIDESGPSVAGADVTADTDADVVTDAVVGSNGADDEVAGAVTDTGGESAPSRSQKVLEKHQQQLAWFREVDLLKAMGRDSTAPSGAAGQSFSIGMLI
jgi:hypothetical protein